MGDGNINVRQAINQRLAEEGEKEILKELLRKRLSESGWRDQLKEQAKEEVRARGLQQVTVDELVTAITPHGRDLVPESVKRELLTEIKKFLEKQAHA